MKLTKEELAILYLYNISEIASFKKLQEYFPKFTRQEILNIITKVDIVDEPTFNTRQLIYE